MADQSAVGKKSKRKGKTYEAHVASLLTQFTNTSFRRVPSSGGFNKTGGVVVATQIFTGDVFCDNPDFKFSVEAKNRKDISLTALLRDPTSAKLTKYWYQCVEDAKNNNRKPIMFFKPNTNYDWVCLTIEDSDKFGLKPESSAIYLGIHVYSEAINLSVIIRDKKGKRIGKEKKNVIVPNFNILDWHELTKHVKPEWLFGDGTPSSDEMPPPKTST